MGVSESYLHRLLYPLMKSISGYVNLWTGLNVIVERIPKMPSGNQNLDGQCIAS
jgi:hypothetical protein